METASRADELSAILSQRLWEKLPINCLNKGNEVVRT
jgi:hypothetical protein